MSITSTLFLLLFLPLALVIYYIANNRAQEYVLLGISLIFYALGSAQYLILFIFVIIITVFVGRKLNACSDKKTKKVLLIIGIIFNSGILIYYKYTDFILETVGKLTSTEVQLKEIVLPLGISFFTFKSISYLVDIYRGVAILEPNPVHDALYLSFFAQVQMGPLSRYNGLEKGSIRHFDMDLFSDGVYRFLIGFSKKVLIAYVLSNITNEVFATPIDKISTPYAWLGSICYSLQLLFDFAGYSDMAIGLSEMFGYRCMENFNYPYMTESVSQFWKRWHISLGEWFRDYIYIPLGGSRTKTRIGKYFNLFIVWFLTGLWHGASWNYVVWGMASFVAIIFERNTKLPKRLHTSLGKTVYRVLTLFYINFTMVIFNTVDLHYGWEFIKKMLVYTSNEVANARTMFLICDYGFFIVLAIILCFPVVPKLDEKLKDKGAIYTTYDVIKTLIIVFAFVWSVSFVVAGQNNPFVYASF